MRRRRNQALAALIVLVAGRLIAAVLGLSPIHPNPQGVPSVAASSPSAKWAGAVERGRHVVRTGLVEQNLPGLSVAVGAGGEIVWAEGYGWADLQRRVPVEPDTRFRIGTASKALTAAAVGVLAERGRLEPLPTRRRLP